MTDGNNSKTNVLNLLPHKERKKQDNDAEKTTCLAWSNKESSHTTKTHTKTNTSGKKKNNKLAYVLEFLNTRKKNFTDKSYLKKQVSDWKQQIHTTNDCYADEFGCNNTTPTAGWPSVIIKKNKINKKRENTNIYKQRCSHWSLLARLHPLPP